MLLQHNPRGIYKRLLYSLLFLTACNSNTAHNRETLEWSELCQGHGSGIPLFVVDGKPIDPDSMPNAAVDGELIIIKNSSQSITLRAEDIEKVEVIKDAAGDVGHDPDRCTILITTKEGV